MSLEEDIRKLTRKIKDIERAPVSTGSGTPASSVVSLDGSDAVGVGTNYARNDHKHGDTARHTHGNSTALALVTGSNTGDQTLEGLGGVATSRKVAGHDLTADVTVSKSDVGLGNCDNTTDALKPISTATQTALDLKAPINSPAFTGTPTGITATHVGLGNCNNTSDASKPISTATQTALDLKAPINSPAFTGTPTGITATHVGLGNCNNTSDAAKPVSTATSTLVNAVLGVYRTLIIATGSHIATKVAGTYMLGCGDPAAVSGTGVLYPIQIINIASGNFPTVNALAPKLRVRATISVNNTAPTGNFTVGFYPVTSGAGAAGVKIWTTGTLVSGSATTTVTTPAGSSATSVSGSDFALPADGNYCLAVVTTATVATSSLVHINATLEWHNA